ncbi:hypothetical protein [Microbacterium sp. P01]|uniref:hypothetical protein n=1 Tax=unclassified Microbacterium TaxID=2609290 RepID=UPI00366CF171
MSVRQVLSGLAIAFMVYFAARAVLWTPSDVMMPWLIYLTLVVFLGICAVCLFWTRQPTEHHERERASDPARGLRGPAPLPGWACALALFASAAVPNAIAYAVGPDSRTASYSTWTIGGIGVLMVIVMVRRRAWVAWVGTAIMGLSAMFWFGPLNALALGLVGSIVWVVIAQLLVRSMGKAARDTTRLAELQRAASAWQASQSVRQRERRVQVQRALLVAGPVLMATVASGGALDPAQRLEARIAEGQLRDEMRGPRLIDDAVRAEIGAARRRGATVTVLDEGGLDELSEIALRSIRAELAETLRNATSARLYIRTSPHERVAITVVGRAASSAGLSDEDSVDLWREISHPDARES